MDTGLLCACGLGLGRLRRDSLPIDEKLDTKWCELFIDVHPSLTGCVRFLTLPKKGHIGYAIKTVEDYVATFCGLARIERDETPYGFLKSLMMHKRSDLVGEERGKECCAVGFGDLDYLDAGDFESALCTVISHINSHIAPYKEKPMLEVEDGQPVMSQALVDIAFGKAWSELSSRSFLAVESLDCRQTILYLCQGARRRPLRLRRGAGGGLVEERGAETRVPRLCCGRSDADRGDAEVDLIETDRHEAGLGGGGGGERGHAAEHVRTSASGRSGRRGHRNRRSLGSS